MRQTPFVTLEPDFATWARLVNEPASGEIAGRSVIEWKSITRSELGLPGTLDISGRSKNQILIGTGHQATFWHPGILAKFVAARVLADQIGPSAAAVHLVVDQDVNRFGSIDVPVIRNGVLDTASIQLLESDTAAATGWQPAQQPSSIAESDLTRVASESVLDGLLRIQHEFARHAHAPSAAHQVAAALTDLMQPLVGRFPLVFATDLMRTSFGEAILQRMRSDPERSALLYNRAVGNVPAVRLKPLDVRGTNAELPLWRIDDKGVRHRAFADDLDDDSLTVESFHPRALLMTAIVRLAVFDLFIHGTGGHAYDMAMEQWIEAWLGLRCAPIAMATTDVFLPLNEDTQSTSVPSAIHNYRRAWHDPRTLQSRTSGPTSEKRMFLDKISDSDVAAGAKARKERFFEMHRWLASQREQNTVELDELRKTIADAQRTLKTAAIAARRDWAFPFYPPETLAALWRDGL